MNYLNKALDTFPTNVVNPMYYVFFSTATIIASLVLFQGLGTPGAKDSFSLLCGFLVIFMGVYLLNLSRDPEPPHRHGVLEAGLMREFNLFVWVWVRLRLAMRGWVEEEREGIRKGWVDGREDEEVLEGWETQVGEESGFGAKDEGGKSRRFVDASTLSRRRGSLRTQLEGSVAHPTFEPKSWTMILRRRKRCLLKIYCDASICRVLPPFDSRAEPLLFPLSLAPQNLESP